MAPVWKTSFRYQLLLWSTTGSIQGCMTVYHTQDLRLLYTGSERGPRVVILKIPLSKDSFPQKWQQPREFTEALSKQ